MKEKQAYMNAIAPRLNTQTLQQFSQLRVFIDDALKTALAENFESQEKRTDYLVSALYQIRDYLFTQIKDNSFRMEMIENFKKIEEEIIMQEQLVGNESLESERLENQEEKLEQGPLA